MYNIKCAVSIIFFRMSNGAKGYFMTALLGTLLFNSVSAYWKVTIFLYWLYYIDTDNPISIIKWFCRNQLKSFRVELFCFSILYIEIRFLFFGYWQCLYIKSSSTLQIHTYIQNARNKWYAKPVPTRCVHMKFWPI